MDQDIKTPETHPDHETVGSYFKAWNGHLYFCDSYDPRCGFWMTNILNAQDRRNVSTAAIGRTFHEQHGHVRRHHEHHLESQYHSVDLRQPDADSQPFCAADMATHNDPNVLVFFDEMWARMFVRNLRKAAKETAAA